MDGFATSLEYIVLQTQVIRQLAVGSRIQKSAVAIRRYAVLKLKLWM